MTFFGDVRRLRTWSRSTRAIARLLIAAQISAVVPALGAEASGRDAGPKRDEVVRRSPALAPGAAPAPPVKVNHTVPKVTPPTLLPQFSAQPSDEELFRARVFHEPLVPMGRTTPEENRALAAALTAYLKGGHPEDTAGLEEFLARHQDSAWSAGLLANLGVVYRRTGFFTRAYTAWERAWALSREETETRSRAIADKALAELAELAARLGRMDAVERLLAEAKQRPLQGSVTEKITGAQEGLWLMQHKPEEAFKCGPMALDRILDATRAGYSRDARLVAFPSTTKGTSLAQMAALSAQVGLSMQMAFRTSGSKVLVPAMVHWKAGHFAALVKEDGGRYLMQDPTFGDEMWVTLAALDDEASGYFLVPKGDLPPGWKAVGTAEGEGVWGKGAAAGVAPNVTGATPGQQTGGNASGNCPAMAGYTFNTLAAGLHLIDTPVGYAPPLGPDASFTLRYTQRDIDQPQVFSYSNLGPKWTFEWLSYLEDDPSNPSAPANLYLRGGGLETNSGFNAATSSYARSYYTEGIVVRTSAAPVRYERRLADGSIEVFAQPDGAATFPRRVFMTESIDPQGNRLQFTYDASLRLVATTDALGQVTTLSYELPDDPLKITRVTDPFGRFASMEYDGSGRLVKITDVIGMSSEFTYAGPGDFISALTTPYGTTQFSTGQNGYNRWIEATDPLGGRERLEFRNSAADLVPGIPPSAYPPGYWPFDVQDTMSVYWSKRAMATAYGDFNAAHIIHWMRNINFSQATGTRSYEKRPLEGRVWFSYPGQSNVGGHRFIGTLNQPSESVRILDDGQLQRHRYEYGPRGNLTRYTDPLGRVTVYNYDPGGVDLLSVQQLNGSSLEALRSYTYNDDHEELTATDAAGQTTTMTYRPNGQLESVTTAPRAGISENRTTTYSYDPSGAFLTGVAGPVAGATTSYAYDGFGRLRTVTDSEGYAVTRDYDAMDRPTRLTYPDGTYEETVYDRLDVSEERDRLGQRTHSFHDALRRVTASSDALGRTTTYDWCSCGGLERVVDADGKATRWERDVAGRITKETRADDASWTFSYEDTTRRRHRRTDPLGQATTYTYAPDDNLLQITYANALVPTANVSYAYDPIYNRIASMTDGTGTTSYTYKPVTTPPVLGASALGSVTAPLPNSTISYGYDELGRVAARGLGGFQGTSAYDTLGRTTSLTSPAGAVSWTYVGATTRPESATYANGQVTSFAYEGNEGDHRLAALTHRRSAAGPVQADFAFAFDAVGRLTTKTSAIGGGPQRRSDFDYDREGQLRGVSIRDTITQQQLTQFAYAYDAVGDRTIASQGSSTSVAAFNVRHQLTVEAAGGALPVGGQLSEAATVSVNGSPAAIDGSNRFAGVAPVGTGPQFFSVVATDMAGNTRTNTYSVNVGGASRTLTYDANGNTTSSSEGGITTTYEWDAENRLVAVKRSGATLAGFAYDGAGRRVSKSVAGITHTYLYDGPNVVQERLSNGTTFDYLQGPGFDRPLLRRDQAGAVAYYLVDELGSVVAMTDAAGAVTLTRDYDPFGSPLEGAAAEGYAFTGREWDAEIGLYYYRARYYDPRLGRFLSQDSRNRADYVYVGNQPTGLVDPSGHFEVRNNIVEQVVAQSAIPQGAVARTSVASGAGCWCDGCDDGKSRMHTILYLGGNMLLPAKVLRSPCVDKSVVDTITARAHEYGWHINPAIEAARSVALPAEAKDYGCKGECETACKKVQKKMKSKFDKSIAASQWREKLQCK